MDHTRVFNEIAAGRAAAHRKHGQNSIEAKGTTSDADLVFWLACLGEEYGEVVETFTYDKYDPDLKNTRKELLDLVSVATAWIDAIDRKNS
jgi:NTP pyrophosphatase (non-canonical NTP hydrolase)